jgi:hypothetical protein
VLYLYGSFTYDSTLVKQSYTELLLCLTESGKSPAAQLFGVKLRSKADDFIRLRRNYMRQEKFKMERQGLINVGDEIEISEYQSFMNYSYIIEPAVAMSGCYPNAERIRSRKGIVKNIEHTPRGFIVTAEFDE